MFLSEVLLLSESYLSYYRLLLANTSNIVLVHCFLTFIILFPRHFFANISHNIKSQVFAVSFTWYSSPRVRMLHCFFVSHSCSSYSFLASPPWSSLFPIANSLPLHGSFASFVQPGEKKKVATFLLWQAFVAHLHCVGGVPASHYTINFKLITPFIPFFSLYCCKTWPYEAATFTNS